MKDVYATNNRRPPPQNPAYISQNEIMGSHTVNPAPSAPEIKANPSPSAPEMEIIVEATLVQPTIIEYAHVPNTPIIANQSPPAIISADITPTSTPTASNPQISTSSDQFEDNERERMEERRKESKKFIKKSRKFFKIAIATLVLGMILISSGFGAEKLANQMNPDEDFAVITPECEIVHVFISSRTKYCEMGKNNRRACGCDREYSYLIYAPQLAVLNDYYITNKGENYSGTDYNYKSQTKKEKLEGVDSCEEATAFNFYMREGQRTECWHPRNPGEPVHKNYKCGNPECVKIYSPYDETNDAKKGAQALLLVGVLLCCGSFYCGFISYLSRNKGKAIVHNVVVANNTTSGPSRYKGEVIVHNGGVANNTTSGAILFRK